MFNKLRIISALIIFFISCRIGADNSCNDEVCKNKLPSVAQFFILETMLGINAWMASEDPHLYGGVSALLAPMFVGGEGTNKGVSLWVTLACVESIAFYNLNINVNETSKQEIIRGNMLAWHLLLGSLLLTDYVIDSPKSKTSVNLIPVSHGGSQLVFSYRF
jgi:hypothetical protein